MQTARSSPYGGLPDRDPPGQRPLSPWTETLLPLDRDSLVPCPFWGVGYWGYPAVRYLGQGRVSEGRVYRHPNYKNGKYASYWNAFLFVPENNVTPKEKDAFIAIRKILNCVNLSGLQDEQITLQKDNLPGLCTCRSHCPLHQCDTPSLPSHQF